MKTQSAALFGATIFIVSCSSGTSPTAADPVAQLAGSWLCNFTLVQDSGATEFVTTYQPSPVKTVINGSALSIYDEESDSEPQSWFCGFNYSIAEGTVSLAGTPRCTSNTIVQVQSAAITLAPDGNELTLQESGAEDDRGQLLQSTISGICARNE